MSRNTRPVVIAVSIAFLCSLHEAQAFHLFHHHKDSDEQKQDSSQSQTTGGSPASVTAPTQQQPVSTITTTKQTTTSVRSARDILYPKGTAKPTTFSKTGSGYGNTGASPAASTLPPLAIPSSSSGSTIKLRTFDPTTSTTVPINSSTQQNNFAGDSGSTTIAAPTNNGSGQAMPGVPTVGVTPPPDLPQRPPLPSPPAVSLIPPAYAINAKDSLEWRSRAYKMQNNPVGQAGAGRSQVAVNAGLVQTLGAIRNTLPQCGFTIEEVCSTAGQVCARSRDPNLSRYRFIYTVTEADKDNSVVKVGVDPDSRAVKNSSIDNSLQQIQAAISKAGAL